MTKYYLIKNDLLVKGDTIRESGGMGFVENAFAFRNGIWEKISRNEINDRIIGYDPCEEGCYGIGNTDIMDELREISEEEANQIMQDLKMQRNGQI